MVINRLFFHFTILCYLSIGLFYFHDKNKFNYHLHLPDFNFWKMYYQDIFGILLAIHFWNYIVCLQGMVINRFFFPLYYIMLWLLSFSWQRKKKNQKYNNNNNCKKLVNKSHLLPPTSTNHMYSHWSNHQSCVSRRNGGVAYPWIHQSSTFLGRGRRRISAKLIWTDFKKGKTTLTRK